MATADEGNTRWTKLKFKRALIANMFTFLLTSLQLLLDLGAKTENNTPTYVVIYQQHLRQLNNC
jgi:hypothetical protein